MNTPRSRPPRYVVGIGASAGGLEALKLIIRNLPADTQLAYLIAQHMSPQHRGLLTELLGKQTTLPVVEAEDDAPIEAGHLYVCPPNADITLNGDLIRLTTPSQAVVPKPSIAPSSTVWRTSAASFAPASSSRAPAPMAPTAAAPFASRAV
ncbi:hypothetical protein CKO23_20815 [Thiocystis violacea]|nr:hypothetical protein [Thiocystis violacea]